MSMHGTDESRQYLADKCGGKATYPALEHYDGDGRAKVMLESGDIIRFFCQKYDVDIEALRAYQFTFGETRAGSPTGVGRSEAAIRRYYFITRN